MHGSLKSSQRDEQREEEKEDTCNVDNLASVINGGSIVVRYLLVIPNVRISNYIYIF